MGFRNPILGGGGSVLLRPAIQSPNFLHLVRGWQISRAGDAEFNNIRTRGVFMGSDYVINDQGIFLYSGTPAAGNLVGSWAPVAGTDAYGNAYVDGLTQYSSGGTINLTVANADTIARWLDTVNGAAIDISVGGGIAVQEFSPPTSGGATWVPAAIAASVSNVFGLNTAELTIAGAYNTAHVSRPAITMFGSSDTSTQNRIDVTCQKLNVSGDLTVWGGTDAGRGIQTQASVNANVSGITTTETALMTIPSMTYVSGRAYRVTLWGLHQSSAVSTYFLYRLRKGIGIAGTVYKDQMRVPTLPVASSNGAVSLVVTLVNTSGADITTEMTWTGSCASGTGVFAASANNLATATVEDVGLAAQWTGQPIS